MIDLRLKDGTAAIVPLVAAFLLLWFGLYPLAGTLTGGEAVQWYRHASRFWLVIGGSLLVALLLLGALLSAPIERAWSWTSARVLAVPAPWFVGVAALGACALSAAIAIVCFGRQPHNADEVAQLFHAKILLSGRLTLPVDPNPEFFGMDNMIDTNRWYSQFPIGGPAFLALGTALRAAWLVNPVLLGLTVVAVYQFTRRAYDEPTARVSVILLALCPFGLFMSASFMNHTPVLWLASVALAQLAAWMDASDAREANRSAALIGLPLGMAFTVRPLDALVVAGVIGVVQLRAMWVKRDRVRSLAFQVMAGLIPVVAFLVINSRMNGSPLRLGYEVLYGESHSLGFHTDPYGVLHTPLRAVVLASKYLLQLNVLLFGWPLPVVGIIAVGLLAGRRPTTWDLTLLGLLFAQVVAYAMYWHDGSFRGPRFLFTALPALVILTARAPVLLARSTRGAVRAAVLLAIPVSMAIVWLAPGVGTSVPFQVRHYLKLAPITRANPDSLERAAGLQNALVFVNEGRDGRNLHDLWLLGLSRGQAARVMVSASACAVRVSIETERARRPASEKGRLDRIVLGARSVDGAEPPLMPAICSADVARDNQGTASFAPFFPANDIDSEGRVAGNVIYLLDMGKERNEGLRTRFAARNWYRLGPMAKQGDLVPTPVPYSDAP